MKYLIKPSASFRKDLKKAAKKGYDLARLKEAIVTLAEGEKLSEKYRDHALSGEYAGCRECHIAPDWLLVYEIYENELMLYLIRTGSHSDLFG